MIPYHGTPISGTRTSVVEFLRGRHALVPFSRPDDVYLVAEICQSFCFDNGAFSIWKKGGKIDLPSYYRWCEEWYRHPGFDWALIPDVIEGSEKDNDALLKDWPSHIKGVPVYHLHESLDRLDRLVHEQDVVAIGSSGEWPNPGTSSWWARMAEVMEVACDEAGRPRARLHGLRMLNPKIFSRLPLSSADSTNAGVNCSAKDRFGMYCPPTSGQRAAVIASRIEAISSAAYWTPRNKASGIPEENEELIFEE